jgi:hypothetical protein
MTRNMPYSGWGYSESGRKVGFRRKLMATLVGVKKLVFSTQLLKMRNESMTIAWCSLIVVLLIVSISSSFDWTLSKVKRR